MNKKGFTMVELLGTVVILGILLTMAIAGYTRYQDSSSQKAYNLMHQGMAQAAENYFMDTLGSDSVTLDELVEGEYMDSAKDPWNKDGTCTGKVERSLGEGSSARTQHDDVLEEYYYEVQLRCNKGCTCLEYPTKKKCDCDI